MNTPFEQVRLAALRAYAAGQLGTRQAIERAGLRDYADLVIALVQHDLPLPKPAATPLHEAHQAIDPPRGFGRD